MNLSQERKEKQYINKWMLQILKLEKEKYFDGQEFLRDEGYVTINEKIFYAMLTKIANNGDFYVCMASGHLAQRLNRDFYNQLLRVKIIINNNLKDTAYLFALSIDNPYKIKKEWCVKYIDDYDEEYKTYLKEKKCLI